VVSVGFGFLTTTKTSCGHLVITRTPAAKHKLHEWSSDGALLMRRGGGKEIEQIRQTHGARCPLMIS